MVVKEIKGSGLANTQPISLEKDITFTGSGWGHGVGMSQYGASNMAKASQNYIQILEFYFTGTKVE